MQKIVAFFFAIIASFQTARHEKILCHFFAEEKTFFT